MKKTEDKTTIKKALEMLKEGTDMTIKIPQGTIFQSGGYRYLIGLDGTITYKSDGKIQKVTI